MPRFQLFLLFFLGVTVVSGIFLEKSSSSSSSSSEEHHYHKKPHRHHHHRPHRPKSSSSSEEPRPRPHKPRPSRPPRPPTRKPNCPSDWMTFNRPQGTWCVKVFYTAPVLQVTAQQLCQGQGANLTGVQDANENAQIAAAARLVINQNGGGQAEVWLGASRKPTCPLRTSCAPLYTFDWTDGHTTGVAGFQWAPSEPNGLIFPTPYNPHNWGQQMCLDQLISGNSDKSLFGYPHGSMDDTHCQKSYRLYACGKRPS
ncbi:hypothetical protein CAEBREN_15571 [Caenorhabditis brenneri]|uniref:C-type lectin domain-containing protein n=1 Tax=Caenorhabditis brenneri TaxID=135651 RepID=G0MIR7_CAEBE|nr:hypothetical protein CAEBREN_15571 [Caenorhabditis brenneri]